MPLLEIWIFFWNALRNQSNSVGFYRTGYMRYKPPIYIGQSTFRLQTPSETHPPAPVSWAEEAPISLLS